MVSLGNVCIHDARFFTHTHPAWKMQGRVTDKDFLVPKDAYHYKLCVCVCVCLSLSIYILVNVSTHGHFPTTRWHGVKEKKQTHNDMICFI